MSDSLSVPGKPAAEPASIHQLADRHTALDSQLQQLTQKRFLSPEEEMEAVRLKKLKLHVKDAMRQLRT